MFPARTVTTRDAARPTLGRPSTRHADGAVAEVVVSEAWNGWRTASVRVTDIEEVHWRQPSGAPCAMIHGYVSCGNVPAGLLPHDCCDTPHRLLVCVLKCHAVPHVFAGLVHRADSVASRS
jgi:hypothetical protein